MHKTVAAPPEPAAPDPRSDPALPFSPEAWGVIEQLWVYPVKSCAGIALTQSRIGPAGLDLDRAWMVVDATGRFVSQRQFPRMALVRPLIEATALRLQAPDLPDLTLPFAAAAHACRVSVWDDTLPALDQGDASALWFSRCLGQPGLRLVRFDPLQQRLSSLRWTGGVAAPNRFSDGYPLLLTTAQALAPLNQRLQALGQPAVTLARMRANLIVGGLPAHDEDHWDALFCAPAAAPFQPSEPAVLLQPVKPCARCSIPNIDPASAAVAPHVTDALQTYRQDARLDGALSFGMNAIVRQGAGQTLCVGQAVGVRYRFDVPA